MQARINVITLSVANLEKSLAFYRDGLEFPSKGILGTEFHGTETEPSGAVGFFDLSNGAVLALYPRSELAKDANVRLSRPSPPSPLEFSLGYFVESREEVDEFLRKAEAAGATITDAPHDRPWGIYSGYFQDLDGHLWEIIWSFG